MNKTKKFLAGVAAILIAIILVGSIIGLLVISIQAKAWPVLIGLALLVYFAFKPAFEFVKGMIERDES